MSNRDKIQYLLITHLLKEGQIQLDLPSGIKLSLGITKESKRGLEKCPDYCWMEASQEDKTINLDSFNLGLKFSPERLVFRDKEEDVCTLDVV